MSKKEKEVEAELAKRDDAAPNSVGSLIEAEKHATREEVDAMTNKATDPTLVNVVEELSKVDEEPKKAKPVSDAEFERRSKLDVSDPLYLNPSLDHKG